MWVGLGMRILTLLGTRSACWVRRRRQRSWGNTQAQLILRPPLGGQLTPDDAPHLPIPRWRVCFRSPNCRATVYEDEFLKVVDGHIAVRGIARPARLLAFQSSPQLYQVPYISHAHAHSRVVCCAQR